jgi:hypothetical protein
MDRHLIYPPGYKKDKNKSKDDWDADPSLKGCAFAFHDWRIYLLNLYAQQKKVAHHGYNHFAGYARGS